MMGEYPGLEARGHDVRYTFHNVSANVTRELSPPFIIGYPIKISTPGVNKKIRYRDFDFPDIGSIY